jgi:hypothetical protein
MIKEWERKGCNLGNKSSWIAQDARLAKKGKLQAKRKDHHALSTHRHLVSSHSSDKDNILR